MEGQQGKKFHEPDPGQIALPSDEGGRHALSQRIDLAPRCFLRLFFYCQTAFLFTLRKPWSSCEIWMASTRQGKPCAKNAPVQGG